MAFRAQVLPARTPARSGLVEEVRNLRQELNWYYRKIDRAETRRESHSPEQVGQLQRNLLAWRNIAGDLAGATQRLHEQLALLQNLRMSLVAEDGTGRGADVEGVEVQDDILVSSSPPPGKPDPKA